MINDYDYVSGFNPRSECVQAHTESQHNVEKQSGLNVNKDSDSIMNKVYVIIRNLNDIPKIGTLAHFGLLLQTNSGHSHTLEYGVETNPNKVTLTNLNNK